MSKPSHPRTKPDNWAIEGLDCYANMFLKLTGEPAKELIQDSIYRNLFYLCEREFILILENESK